MRRLPHSLLGLILLAAPATPADRVGQKVADVAFTDARGKSISLDVLRGKSALVVVFLSFDCPVSGSYLPALGEMAGKYADRGVAFVGVDPVDEADAAECARQARARGLPFPVFPDTRAAAAFGAVAVPEAFVLDADLVLRYRGQIDDTWSERLRRRPRPGRADLAEALEDVLAGRPVRVPATRAVGCPIPREPAAAAAGRVTFHRDVLPILQARCQACHRPGEVGPFALVTYRQGVRWAAAIKEATQGRRMPPWKPAEGLAFHNDRRLSDQEIATLAAWADGGTPEGHSRDAPPPRTFAEGWQLGEPDLVLAVPEDMTVGPSGPDLYRVFVLPTHLAEDRSVSAVEVRPGNRRVVHHAVCFFDRTGKGRALQRHIAPGLPGADGFPRLAGGYVSRERSRAPGKDDADHGPGYSVAMGVGFRPEKAEDQGDLGAWAPGQRVWPLPEGTGYRLPRGADVLVQVHYHRTGRAEADRTSVGLYFAKTPVRRPLGGLVVSAPFLYIPAGEARFRVRGAVEVERDCRLVTLLPHMHRLGREVRVSLTPPGGAPVTVLAIRDWDYRWQETYYLREPLTVRAGSRLAVEAVFDNSAGNPENPFRPPRPVVFGDQTDDEMCSVFLGVTWDGKGPVPAHFAGP
jgi:peroxiredoxin